MNRHTLSTALAAAALALAPLAATAQDAAEPAPPPATAFAAFDTDGDGQISQAEWDAAMAELPVRLRHGLITAAAGPEAARAAAAAALVSRLDADGDGLLSAEELAAGWEALAEGRAAMAARQGAGRGEMSDRRGMGMWGEMRADAPRGMRGQMHGKPRGEAGRPMRGEARAEMPAEMRPMRQGMSGGLPPMLAFEAIDTDGDGAISREEFTAAQERWAERRGQWRGGPRQQPADDAARD